jgi:hypothetical protein
MRYQIRAELPENKFVDFDVNGPDPTADLALDKVRAKAEGDLINRFPDLPLSSFDWRGYVVFVRPRPQVSASFQRKMDKLLSGKL